MGFLVYIIDTNLAAVGEDLGDKVLSSPGYILRDVETTIATVEDPFNEPDIAGNKIIFTRSVHPRAGNSGKLVSNSIDGQPLN